MIIDFIIESLILPTLILLPAVFAFIRFRSVRIRAALVVALVALHLTTVAVLGGTPSARNFWPVEPWVVCHILSLAGAFALLITVWSGIAIARKRETNH